MLVGLLLLAAGCGGSGEPVVRPPVTPASAPAATRAPTPTAAPPRHPAVTVVPSTGLAEGQTVAVTGTGFSPGLALVVVQCVDRGTATGSGDCNLPALVSVTADATGTVHARLRVSKGPYGTPPLLCSGTTRCLVSVNEATLQPKEQAGTPVTFR